MSGSDGSGPQAAGPAGPSDLDVFIHHHDGGVVGVAYGDQVRHFADLPSAEGAIAEQLAAIGQAARVWVGPQVAGPWQPHDLSHALAAAGDGRNGRPGGPWAHDHDPEQPGGMATAALAYAAAGIPVFPCYSVARHQLASGPAMVCTCGDLDCSSPGKHPIAFHGVKEATADPARVAGWWADHPGANIGIATGVAFDVLDLDGDEGIAAMRQFVQEHGLDLSGAPVVRTGSGGFHYLFAASGAGNRAHFLPHVDWRGLGGYVIAPPSLHARGRRYAWLDGRTWRTDRPLPPVPGALLERVRRQEPSMLDVPRFTPDGTGHPYGLAALTDELEKVAAAPKGSRNHTLNVAACKLYSLVAGGVLDEGDVRRGLENAALRAGLRPREIQATLRSAYLYGTQRPRGIPDRPFARMRSDRGDPGLEHEI